MHTLYRPSLPSNEKNWRIGRLLTLVWFWLFPLTTLSRAPGGGLALSPHPMALVSPSLGRFVLIAAMAWQVYQLMQPARPGVLMLAPRNHDMAEWMRLGFAAVFGWVSMTALRGGVFDRLLAMPTIEPRVASLITYWFAFLISYGWVAIALIVDTTVIDTQARTVTRFFIWPRKFTFDALHGLGEIRVNIAGRGAERWLGVFPKSGAPWRVLHSGPTFDADLAELVRATGLQPARK